MADEIAEVRQLLASVAEGEPVDSFGEEDLLFERGVLDSLHLLLIVDQFEGQFGIEVSAAELSPENFGSIAAMARFLSSRRGDGGLSRSGHSLNPK